MSTAMPQILLAEDDPADVELALSAMTRINLSKRVAVANHGEDALDYLHHRGRWRTRVGGHPAVILLDLKMPRVGGLEVLRSIRGDTRTQSIPVVILTSSCEKNDIARCYAQGANAYVVKPVDFPVFVLTLQRVGHFWASVNVPPPARHNAAPGQ